MAIVLIRHKNVQQYKARFDRDGVFGWFLLIIPCSVRLLDLRLKLTNPGVTFSLSEALAPNDVELIVLRRL